MQLSLNYMSTSVIVVMLQVWRAQSYLCVVWEFLLFSLRVIVMLQVWHAQWRTFVSSGSCWCLVCMLSLWCCRCDMPSRTSASTGSSWCLVCMLSLWCCRCDMPSRTSASTGCVDWEFLMFSLHVIVVMLQVWRAHWRTFMSSGSCWCLACMLSLWCCRCDVPSVVPLRHLGVADV